MQVSWSKAAAFEAADSVGWAQAESEALTMFADSSVLGMARRVAHGLLSVELPCGLEVDFEVVEGEDRVHIQWAGSASASTWP